MKKNIVLASCLVASFAAQAQSSVTLYGIFDEGVDYTSNVEGHSAWQMTSGYAQGSRWGLKGTEELGSGWKTLFTLENGFNGSNGTLGQGGRMFGRQAFVGLGNATYGTVLLGRQYDSVVDYLGPLTANGSWAGYLFAHPLDNDNTDNTFRANNTVKYTSPNVGGFHFGGTYGLSNQSNFAANRLYSLGVGYAWNGLSASAAYLKANNPGASADGALASGATSFVASSLEIYGVGAKYNFASATLAASYTHSSILNPAATGTQIFVGSIASPGATITALRFNNFELNGTYYVRPDILLGAMYIFTQAEVEKTNGNSNLHYHTVGLMADYFISKRTDVYIQGAYERVGGGKSGTVLDTAYVSGAAGVSSSMNQTVVRAAIRYKF
ncbi:porin [Paraburkholderia sediminicola]|uniref:porin n=1 Tax=Paraburkholderia sediminicola TaxID=458836 RepID=UPI0038B8CFF4